MTKSKLFLIDGSAIFYRSYFAFIQNPLINSRGENTSTTFGFLNTIFKIIEDETPEYFCIVFDTKAPTFRHDMYSEYKATREKMPEEMAETIPRMMQALTTLQMNLMEKDGYEADDIIATIARKCASTELDIFIVSGDKDFAQLVSENIFIYTPAKSGSMNSEILGRSEIKEKYGVYPEQIVDFLALIGDKSDNVPGVPRVGVKSAQPLLEKYGDLDQIYMHVDDIAKNMVREQIRENRESAYLSQKLVTLEDQAPVDFTLGDFVLKSWDQHDVDVLLNDMEFNRLIVRAAKINNIIAGDPEIQDSPAKKSVQQKYQLVNDENTLNSLIGKWETVDEFVFDLETDSLDVFSANIAGIAVSFEKDEAYYIAVNHPDSNLSEKTVLQLLKPIFEDKNIKKIGQNIKFDAMIMREHGIETKNIYFDTMIASFLINSTYGQHGLDNLAQVYLDYKTISIEEIIGTGKNQKKMTELPVENVYRYACEDADITWQLMQILKPKLTDLDLDDLFYNIEMPLVSVLMTMEKNGVTLDLDLLTDLAKKLEDDIILLEKKIYELAGEHFNINSPQQLGILLFDKLEIHKELNMRKPKRTKTGQYSTSEQILDRYHRHDLPKNILDYRKLAKLKNTYVDALPNLINPVTGQVHTSYNQAIAATGRLSSVNPNLQNIPIRTEIGRQMRKAFIPKDKKNHILSADYSQIELRIMAHLSQDPNMCDSFEKDLDIHATTAARIFEIPIEEVDAEHRRKAKEINFGIIFGMSKYGLANRLDISIQEAEQFIYDYFALYSKVQEFMHLTIAGANSEGYVRTMRGRIRYLPQIHSTNRQLREFAERTSINTPIQGSAADLIKLAMIEIHQEMQERELSSKMLLQVHDELVFEVPDKELEIMSELVRDKMENAMQLKIPIKVDVGVGKNWLEAH
jgi:DNA polymerase-1